MDQAVARIRQRRLERGEDPGDDSIWQKYARPRIEEQMAGHRSAKGVSNYVFRAADKRD